MVIKLLPLLLFSRNSRPCHPDDSYGVASVHIVPPKVTEVDRVARAETGQSPLMPVCVGEFRSHTAKFKEKRKRRTQSMVNGVEQMRTRVERYLGN